MKKKFEFLGKWRKYDEWKRAINRDYACSTILSKHFWEVDDVQYCHIILECTPYTQEEQEEIDMYGDPEHEDYLMSDAYEDDCRSEQWDWLKNA